eukprot:s1824_g9.t1
MTHVQLQTWTSKPWKLQVFPSSVSPHVPDDRCDPPSSDAVLIPASSHVSNPCQVAGLCCDPLSTPAVSIPDAPGVSQVGLSISVGPLSSVDLECIPVFADVQCKISDEHGPGDRPPTESERALRPIAAGQAVPPPPVVPQFARTMLNDLPEEFLTGVMTLRGFTVRTLRSLPSGSTGLHLLPLYKLMLFNLNLIVIAVNAIIAFDLILSQGLQAGRHSGLVSVYPPVGDQAVPRIVTAVSFLPQVSGLDIVSAVDFQLLCQQYRCLVYFRWQEIPLDPMPVHDMHDGDGFSLHVHGPPFVPQAHAHDGHDGHAAGSSVPAPAPSGMAEPDSPQPMDLDFDSDAARSQADQESEPYSPSSDGGVRGLQRANEQSLIVQMRQDVAFAADEQLLLVDLIAHQHGTDGLPLAPQFTDRRVLKVQHPLTRCFQCPSPWRICQLSPIALVEHFGDDDQYTPPDFTRAIATVLPLPQPAPVALPPIHGLADFQLQFGVTFQEYAHTDFADQGPVLHVRTWLVHHATYPRCTRSYTVELESDPSRWPAALCAPWLDLLQPGAPIAFREIRPNPPRLFRDVFTAHIIIEQGLEFPRYSALISILAAGEHTDGKMQLALSIPQQLSAEHLLRDLHLASRCLVYRCTVWSGIMQFLPDTAEEVFSGIGIYVHIHGPRFRHLLLDYGDQPFWHLSGTGAASSSTADPLSRRLPSVLPPGCEESLQAIADGHEHDAHFSGLFVPHLQVAWQTYLARTAVGPYQFQVVTWFCDHVRLPRSAEYRIAHLPIVPAQWREVLIQTWQDWVLPGLDVDMYIVNPLPLGDAGLWLMSLLLRTNSLHLCRFLCLPLCLASTHLILPIVLFVCLNLWTIIC